MVDNSLSWVDWAFSVKRIYLYTDKPIYRPGQKVFIKGIYRLGYDGDYQIYADKPVSLQVYNPRGSKIFTKDLKINQFGTFNTEFFLDQGSVLGDYRICVNEGNCSFFEVEEYKPSPFKIEISSRRKEYISKESFDLNVEANYYFGVPLARGQVNYTVSSQNFYFDRYSKDYFSFGPISDYQSGYYHYGDRFLFRGETSLSSKGKARISHLLDFAKLFRKESERQSKIIIVDVTVTDSQGQSVSAQKSFIVHQGQFYLGLKSEKRFLARGETISLKVKSVDTQGKEKQLDNLRLSVYKVNWIYAKRKDADGGYSYKWEKKRNLVNKKTFSTDRQGNYSQDQRLEKEGEYEVEVEGRDSFGNKVKSGLSIYVYGQDSVSVLPEKKTGLSIIPLKTNLNLGETGEVIIKSPYPKAKALISIERGRIFDYQVKNIEGNLYHYKFKIKKEYFPNVFLSALLYSNEPEVRFGQVEFKVGTSDKKLRIRVIPNEEIYLPGDEVVLDFFSQDRNKTPLPAELSVAVVDMSVLALKGNPKKDPLKFFYPGFPLTVKTSSNIKNVLTEEKLPVAGGKGGGGMVSDELAKKARGIFKETAVFKADLKTNDQGKGRLSFTLPDNLTTWQIEAVGVTKDTKLGVGYKEFTTKKPLMTTVLKPRFVLPGDQFSLGVKVFNRTGAKRKIEVNFKSKSLILRGRERRKYFSLDKEKAKEVFYSLQAPSGLKEGNHKFEIWVKADHFEDRVVQSIKIHPNTSFEVVSTADFTTQPTVKEYVFLPSKDIIKDKGSLSVQGSATLAVFLRQGLRSLLFYPYGGTEQIADQLKAVAVVKRVLNLPNLEEKLKVGKVEYQGKKYSVDDLVRIGLLKLYNNQNQDGGFSYWPRSASSFYLSLKVVDSLKTLRESGFQVNQAVLQEGIDYLFKKIASDYNLYTDDELLILTAYVLNDSLSSNKGSFLRTKISGLIGNEVFIKEKISNLSLARLGVLLSSDFSQELPNKVFTALDNRLRIDGRGAFLDQKGKGPPSVYVYGSPIKNTALYLEGLVKRGKRTPNVDKVIRWLLRSRDKNGSWGSTGDTVSVIEAFSDYLAWKKETESRFNLKVLINEKNQGGFNFGPETIFDRFNKTVPLTGLKFDAINQVAFKKEDFNTLPNTLYYDLVLKYYLPFDQIAPRDEGFSVVRTVHRLKDKKNRVAVYKANRGDVLRVHLQIVVPKYRRFVSVEDFIPAGLEGVNLNLATGEKRLRLEKKEIKKIEFIPDFEEIRDDRVVLVKKAVKAGVYEFDYFVRALIKGKFGYLPAVVSDPHFPEVFGRSKAGYFIVD